MITTYFPHITLYDEGTVSLVRELLDAASVGGHRRGSHVAAHRLGFPPPLDLQTAPMETTPPPRPSTTLALALHASSQKYQRFFDKSKLASRTDSIFLEKFGLDIYPDFSPFFGILKCHAFLTDLHFPRRTDSRGGVENPAWGDRSFDL